MRAGFDRKGQDRDERPLRHGAGREGQEADQDRAPGAQPGVERKVFLVSNLTCFECCCCLPIFIVHFSFSLFTLVFSKNLVQVLD